MKENDKAVKIMTEVHNLSHTDVWGAFVKYFDYAKELGLFVIRNDREVNSHNFDSDAGKLICPRNEDGKNVVTYVFADGHKERMVVNSISFVHSFLDGWCFRLSLMNEEGRNICGAFLVGNEWYKKHTAETLREKEERMWRLPEKMVMPRMSEKYYESMKGAPSLFDILSSGPNLGKPVELPFEMNYKYADDISELDRFKVFLKEECEKKS